MQGVELMGGGAWGGGYRGKYKDLTLICYLLLTAVRKSKINQHQIEYMGTPIRHFAQIQRYIIHCYSAAIACNIEIF